MVLSEHGDWIEEDVEQFSSDEEDEDSDEEAARLEADEAALIERRRRMELKLFERYDTTEINPRRQCWFLVSIAWLESWQRWLLEGKELPGAIDNKPLFKSVIDGELVENLEPKKHYRAVNPMTWFLMVELYGHDGTPAICRYIVDAYSAPLTGKHMERATRDPAFKARTLAIEIRGKLHPLNVYPDDEDDDDDIVCCCFTERRLDCLLFHLFTCCRYCSRRKSVYHYKQVNKIAVDGSDNGNEEECNVADKFKRKSIGAITVTKSHSVYNPVHTAAYGREEFEMVARAQA
mmetsp:Transcript_17162/g.22285  ORF Transcript_17162/g.22285 Transcript_17162/m.22285 type:complete len:291 (+) Transcript_17162:80-952(+)